MKSYEIHWLKITTVTLVHVVLWWFFGAFVEVTLAFFFDYLLAKFPGNGKIGTSYFMSLFKPVDAN